ncbi:hypothetical protein QTP70_003265 [Hemibagrus guttatus]|uniref:Endonuclease/exonuclease/phosphatase domain-containing protein n=1 Tax=Hemibagrus guttatus TaxID=175788 RepID=A0AAE0Q7E1_9TELE|nr:hypothetical protein QTP70_003265 [Hemibagrus guttatus]
MERRKVDILCVQETRWKGSKARGIGAGFKLFYYGVDSKRNGVGVVLKEEFVRNVLEVGCELEEKERFWSELDEVMESVPTGERVVIGADFNGHVGEGNTGDEEVMGKFGVKERNLEGQMEVDFAKRIDMGVVNTYFQKREEHRVTYKSGGRRTQKLRQALGGQVVLPDDWETTAEVIRETGRKVLGVSSGRRKEDKETCWWNEEVQDSIQRKRLAKKKWDMDRTEENRQEYKELQRRVKREVSKAKQKAYDELYTRLDTREGEKDLYRLARQRDRDGKDVQQVRVIKDRDGRVLTSEESVQRRWKKYFEELMNEENEREKRVEGVNSVEQKVDKIRKDEVRKALKRMKSGKAVGPDDIPVEVWKCLGEAAVEFLASLFNRVLENLEKVYDRVPREELWYCMKKSGVAEKYVTVVQDMYERSRTVVKDCIRGEEIQSGEQTLRDCFGDTDWDVLQGSHSGNIEDVVDCITDYINFCMDIAVPKKRAFRDGNQQERMQREHKVQLREAKEQYKRKLEQMLLNNSMKEVCKKKITGCRSKRGDTIEGDVEMVNQLNNFNKV